MGQNGRSPSFQFYAADYLCDESVQMMTLEEEGIYIRLLAYCWREGTIPADTQALARLCGKGASEEAVEMVKGCFEAHPNLVHRLRHKRLDAEREKQEEWRRKSSEGGKRSGKARRSKKLQAEPPLKGGSTKCEPNTNSSFAFASSSSKEIHKPQAAPFEPPSWVPVDPWRAWLEVRAKKRAAQTPHALALAVKELEKLRLAGNDPGEVLNQSTLRSWTGLFEVRRNGVSSQPVTIYANRKEPLCQ